MTGTRRGFTFIELMVVLVIIGVALAITVPMGVQWIETYKFSASSRELINAAQLVRIKAIGGPIAINVSQVAQGADDSHFVFTTRPCSLSTTPVYGDCDTDHGARPFQEGDYITVAGINNPDFLNGHIFLITDVPTAWTATKTYDVSSDTDVCIWPSVTVTAKSCMENDPNNCLKWPAGLAPQPTNTGLISVVSCVKFIPFDPNDPEQRREELVHFTVKKAGNSMECWYDPQWMDVRVLVPDPSDPTKPKTITDVTGTKPAPIVFGFAGATRNQMTYTVELRKMTRSESGGGFTYVPVDDKKSPPIVFSIMPTGRVRLGNVPHTYTDTD